LAFKAQRALLSATVILSFGLGELLRILTVFCRISSAVSSGRAPIAFSTPAQDILDGDRRWSDGKVQTLAQCRVSRFFQWHFTQIDHNILVVRGPGWVLGLMQVLELPAVPLICSLKKPPEHDARSTRIKGYEG
jgi:hypothetical protein